MLELITGKTEVPDEATAVTATLDDLARVGARRMIAAALQIEVDEYVTRFRGVNGRPRRATRGHP